MKKAASPEYEHILAKYYEQAARADEGSALEAPRGLFAALLKKSDWEHRLQTIDLSDLIVIAEDAGIKEAGDLAGERPAAIRGRLVPQIVKIGRDRLLDASLAEISARGASADAVAKDEASPQAQQELALGWFFQSPAPTDWLRAWPVAPRLLPRDLDELSAGELKERGGGALMKDGKKVQRDFLRDVVVADTRWATVLYTGLQMDTEDIKILFAYLALLYHSIGGELDRLDTRSDITLKTRIGAAIRISGKANATPYYLKHRAALQRWSTARMSIISKDRGEEIVKSIINYEGGVAATGEVTITFNAYFARKMMERGGMQLLDIKRLCALRSPGAVMLCGFVESQAGAVWRGSWRTIAGVLNLSGMQDKEQRRRIKEAIKELVAAGWLLGTSGLAKDTITLQKAGVKK